MNFKYFLLNEQRAYLGQKIGYILTAMQELRDNSKTISARKLPQFAEDIVSQIRTILHSHWPKEELKHLKVLQKVGVAISKAIEDKGDLEGTIAGATGEVEQLSQKLGVPLHNLASPDKDAPDEDKGVDEPEKPAKKQPPPEQPPEQQQPPQAGEQPEMPQQPMQQPPMQMPQQPIQQPMQPPM